MRARSNTPHLIPTAAAGALVAACLGLLPWACGNDSSVQGHRDLSTIEGAWVVRYLSTDVNGVQLSLPRDGTLLGVRGDTRIEVVGQDQAVWSLHWMETRKELPVGPVWTAPPDIQVDGDLWILSERGWPGQPGRVQVYEWYTDENRLYLTWVPDDPRNEGEQPPYGFVLERHSGWTSDSVGNWSVELAVLPDGSKQTPSTCADLGDGWYGQPAQTVRITDSLEIRDQLAWHLYRDDACSQPAMDAVDRRTRTGIAEETEGDTLRVWVTGVEDPAFTAVVEYQLERRGPFLRLTQTACQPKIACDYVLPTYLALRARE